MRQDRTFQELRDISFETNVNLHAEGSCLVKFGNTHVLCTASIDEKIPPWIKKSGKGWITAEYGMLHDPLIHALIVKQPKESKVGAPKKFNV